SDGLGPLYNARACQSCHIPAFARGGVPTKMAWDWSQAGQLTAEGKPFQKKDDHGHVIYDSKKGAFVLGKDVTPAYQWFNGKVTYTLQDDKIDPSTRVPINVFHGEPGAADARIWPVKVFHGRQPYDTERNTLLVPSVGVPNDSAFWYNFDWAKALAAGAEATGAPYSGKYGFVDTQMLWPITHMVAPKDKAVGCHECHTNGGRLAGIDGVYIPGRDHNPWLDRLGWLAALAALLGVTLHAIARVITHLRKED
nr:cytochrome C [Denitromonas sp.]